VQTGVSREDLQVQAVAAVASRLHPSKMSDHENELFGEWSTDTLLGAFFDIRNTILVMWNTDCHKEITLGGVLAVLPKSEIYTDDHVVQVFAYLNREGYINFGVYKQRPRKPLPTGKRRRRVVVIGAGVAGLTAARKLASLGCVNATFQRKPLHRLYSATRCIVYTALPTACRLYSATPCDYVWPIWISFIPFWLLASSSH
jgi:hypothetical protein